MVSLSELFHQTKKFDTKAVALILIKDICQKLEISTKSL